MLPLSELLKKKKVLNFFESYIHTNFIKLFKITIIFKSNKLKK